MKKIYLLFLLFSSTLAMSQTNYPGNTKSGFGGAVGNGTLAVSDNGEVITFVLTKGAGDFNDALVLYIDAKDGGFSTTSGFLDIADGLRKAISGFNGGTERSALTFPAAFTPEYAVAVGNDFAGIWVLQGGSTEHTYITSANVTPTTNTSPTYTFTVNKADIGLTGGVLGFKFFGTYISRTAFRADEAIGDAMTGFTQGYNNQTIVSFNTYLSGILPVKLVDFKAVKERSGVQIKWTVAQEDNIDDYQVQRSSDGVNFSTIQTIKARNQSTLQSGYTATDAKPLSGKNYYRIAINERGAKAYSSVATITMAQGGNNFTINYAPGNTKLNIRLLGVDAGNYAVSIVNSNGQTLQSLRIDHDGSELNKALNLNGVLSKGIYRVVLMNNNSRSSQAFMVP